MGAAGTTCIEAWLYTTQFSHIWIIKKALKGHTFLSNDDMPETGAFVGR
jgi:hypothetical protein